MRKAMTEAPQKRLASLAVFVALASAGIARAQVEDRLADCARIAGSSERLACYDSLSEARKTAAAHDWNRSFSPDNSHGPAAVAEPAALEPDTASSFGFDKGHEQSALTEIQSRYDGEFTGWSGNTLFRLENGQVWKQAQGGRATGRATHPTVTIERTALGRYRMNVEGMSESIRVERVK
jgi:hypothetical protein